MADTKSIRFSIDPLPFLLAKIEYGAEGVNFAVENYSTLAVQRDEIKSLCARDKRAALALNLLGRLIVQQAYSADKDVCWAYMGNDLDFVLNLFCEFGFTSKKTAKNIRRIILGGVEIKPLPNKIAGLKSYHRELQRRLNGGTPAAVRRRGRERLCSPVRHEQFSSAQIIAFPTP
jgi:hypothetical protein